ncbi:Pre-mRNA splicing factor SR-like 1, partial [Cucurbita argyrosperma subsp. sororia]
MSVEGKKQGVPKDLQLDDGMGCFVLSKRSLTPSDYLKRPRELYRLKTYHEVVDEIYNQVDHVEPWMTGNCRGPSTAFCLLYKFFTMKLTVKQMHGLLKHEDSPYIRAIGFLYLRYVADTKTLWNWFEPYVKDEEEFSPESHGRMTTMGAYVRDLLLGQYYFDTLFPRIPVSVLRQVAANLEKLKLPSKHSGVTGETHRIGSEDTARRPPSVKASLSVSFGQRAPHRASTRDSSPVRCTLPPSVSDRDNRDDLQRSPSSRHPDNGERSRDRDHDRERSSDRDHGRKMSKDRDHNRDSRRKDRDRDRDRDRERSRNRERDRDRDRDREREKVEGTTKGVVVIVSPGITEGVVAEVEVGAGAEVKVYKPGNDGYHKREASPVRGGTTEKTSMNLAKLKDIYGDVSEGGERGFEQRKV